MINTTRLRCLIGWLGMLLPWLVVFLSLTFGYPFPDSISATYYIQTCITPFMIILGAAGLLLISYRGYDKIDDIICSCAGAAGLSICLFPCSHEGYVGTFNLSGDISGIIHNVSAVIFFGLLAYNSLFLFTKTAGIMTPNKKKRNIIFKICGIGMIASFVLLVPCNIFNIVGGTWLVEAIALAFFAISWLTKANCYRWLYCD